jgi:hypothetical protein
MRSRPTLEALEGRYCLSAAQVALDAPVLGVSAVMHSSTVADDDAADSYSEFDALVEGEAAGDEADGTSGVGASGDWEWDVGDDSDGDTSPAPEDSGISAPPTIFLHYLAEGCGGYVTLIGQVLDENPAWLTVSLTGAINTEIQTDENGAFTLTTTADYLGTVYAVVEDEWGLGSNTASTVIASGVPMITEFEAIAGPDNMWTFRGRVTDECAAGLQVTLGNMPSLGDVTTTVRDDGWFSICVLLEEGEHGMASAVVFDTWGQGSEEVFTMAG